MVSPPTRSGPVTRNVTTGVLEYLAKMTSTEEVMTTLAIAG
jgi:hypothetical protein